MDEMLDALDKDLESSMEESPGPVRFNPFRFKGFANTKTASVVDASADKENEENSGGNSSGNTTDSDTKEWRRAVDRAKNGQSRSVGSTKSRGFRKGFVAAEAVAGAIAGEGARGVRLGAGRVREGGFATRRLHGPRIKAEEVTRRDD